MEQVSEKRSAREKRFEERNKYGAIHTRFDDSQSSQSQASQSQSELMGGSQSQGRKKKHAMVIESGGKDNERNETSDSGGEASETESGVRRSVTSKGPRSKKRMLNEKAAVESEEEEGSSIKSSNEAAVSNISRSREVKGRNKKSRGEGKGKSLVSSKGKNKKLESIEDTSANSDEQSGGAESELDEVTVSKDPKTKVVKSKKEDKKEERRVDASCSRPGAPVEMISLISDDEAALQALLGGEGSLKSFKKKVDKRMKLEEDDRTCKPKLRIEQVNEWEQRNGRTSRFVDENLHKIMAGLIRKIIREYKTVENARKSDVSVLSTLQSYHSVFDELWYDGLEAELGAVLPCKKSRAKDRIRIEGGKSTTYANASSRVRHYLGIVQKDISEKMRSQMSIAVTVAYRILEAEGVMTAEWSEYLTTVVLTWLPTMVREKQRITTSIGTVDVCLGGQRLCDIQGEVDFRVRNPGELRDLNNTLTISARQYRDVPRLKESPMDPSKVVDMGEIEGVSAISKQNQASGKVFAYRLRDQEMRKHEVTIAKFCVGSVCIGGERDQMVCADPLWESMQITDVEEPAEGNERNTGVACMYPFDLIEGNLHLDTVFSKTGRACMTISAMESESTAAAVAFRALSAHIYDNLRRVTGSNPEIPVTMSDERATLLLSKAKKPNGKGVPVGGKRVPSDKDLVTRSQTLHIDSAVRIGSQVSTYYKFQNSKILY
jgi:hypothetical protein